MDPEAQTMSPADSCTLTPFSLSSFGLYSQVLCEYKTAGSFWPTVETCTILSNSFSHVSGFTRGRLTWLTWSPLNCGSLVL